MTWCFDCSKEQRGDNLLLCKELQHDIDADRLFQVTNYDRKKTVDSQKSSENDVEKLSNFAQTQMEKIVISQGDNSRIYALVRINHHIETMEVDKKNQKIIYWLQIAFHKATTQWHSEEACTNAIGFLRAKISMKEDIVREKIHIRAAYVFDEIYYDLGSTDWKIIKITKDSINIVDYSKDMPVFFRSGKTGQQVIPCLRPEGNPIEEFVNLCRIPDTELFKVHLIANLIADIATPIMAIQGPAGSSKSTVSSMIKRIIDPSGNTLEDNLKSIPHGEDNFVTSLVNTYFQVFENISHIDQETSNMMCRAITGGSFDKRTLYTNGDVFTMSLKRKILINGIDFVINYADMADRSIIYELERVTDEVRKTDQIIENTFRKLLPDLLGQIFLILQNVLRIIDEVEMTSVKLPRMASFGVYGEAIYQVLGHKNGEFLEIYKKGITKNLEILYDANPIIPFLEELLQDKNECEIQSKDLYRQLKNFVGREGYNDKHLPQSPSGIRSWILKSKSLLDEHNYKVSYYKNTKSKRTSGFNPNAMVYTVHHITQIQTHLKENELDM